MRNNKLTPKAIGINFLVMVVLVFSLTVITGMSGEACNKNGKYTCKECNAKYSSGSQVLDSKATVCTQEAEDTYRHNYAPPYYTVECK